MILLIGLGNPGSEYEETKHNVGRQIAKSLQKQQELPDFKFEKKFKAEFALGKIGKEKMAVLCPNTFMNKSGLAVGATARFLKVKPEDIFVIHDDTDLCLGQTKLCFGKHSAGHKGVESVIRALKTRDFWRFRIGTGDKKDTPAEKMVLRKFTPAEKNIIKKVVKKTLQAITEAITESPEKAMNEYNQN